ncbi:MAG: 4-phytase, partial [Deinococcota bacterium]
EELSRLADEAKQTADIEVRSELYDEISQLFRDEGPILIPYFRPVVAAHADNVIGLVLHSFPGRTDFSEVDVSR